MSSINKEKSIELQTKSKDKKMSALRYQNIYTFERQ